MAKSKKVVKKPSSPLKISTSLFQRNSRTSTGSRTAAAVTATTMSSTGSTSVSSTNKKSTKVTTTTSKSKQDNSKSKGSTTTRKEPPKAAGGSSSNRKSSSSASASTTAAASRSKNSGRNAPPTGSKPDPKAKRTVSIASSSSATSAKGNAKAGKTKGQSSQDGKRGKSGKNSEEAAVVKAVKVKQLSDRTTSTASSTASPGHSSRRNSTNAPQSPPPPAASASGAGKTTRGKDAREKSSSKREVSKRSPSRSPSPRLRNQTSSSSSQVQTRKRSQSGSSSFPSSPLSSSSSSAPSSPAQRKRKKKKRVVKTVPKVTPKKSSVKQQQSTDKKSSTTDKKGSKVPAGKKPPEKTPKKESTGSGTTATKKKTRSGSGDSCNSIEAIGKRMRSATGPLKLKMANATTSNTATAKKTDRVIAKKITQKAIKGNSSKSKAKPKLKVRPKSKKRMASLNAKAILEASFSFEPPEKKVKATPSPKLPKHSHEPTPPSASSTSTSTTPATSGDAATRKSTDHHIPKEIKNFENLLTDVKIEIRSGPPPSYNQKDASKGPEKIERKRKSSSAGPTSNKPMEKPRNTTTTTTGTITTTGSSGRSDDRHKTPAAGTATTTAPPKSPNRRSVERKPDKAEKGAGGGKPRKSKSPVPRKKTKVATAECSTSTPAWNWDPALAIYPSPGILPAPTYPDPTQYSLSKQIVSSHAIPAKELQPPMAHHPHQESFVPRPDYVVQREKDPHPHPHHPLPYHHQHHHHQSASSSPSKQKSQGCQAKEKSDSPSVVGGRTVYQPAGPLIEPHKTSPGIPSSGGGFHIPETVRLPPDLKVTYQTHPPNSFQSVVHGSQQSKNQQGGHRSSSSSLPAGGQKSSGSSHKGSSSSLSSSSSQTPILHQPYKSVSSTSVTTVASASTATASSSPALSATGRSSQARLTQSLPPPQPSSAEAAGGFCAGAGLNAVQAGLAGSSGLGTHSAMTAAVAAMSGSGAGPMYYPGFGGPHHSPFTPSKYPMVPPDSYRAHSPYPGSFLYAPPAPQSSSQSYYMTPFYTPPITPTSAPILGAQASVGGQPRQQPVLPHHQGHPSSPAIAAAAAAAMYQSSPSGGSQQSTTNQSSYLLAPPSGPLPPSHHSVSAQPSPGHAGLFRPNQSSPPACPCPTESFPRNSTTSSSSSSSTTNNNNNNNSTTPNSNTTTTTNSKSSSISSSKPLRPQQQPRQPLLPPCATHATPSDPEALKMTAPTPTALRRRKDPVPESPKTDSKVPKQLECTKAFSEQYSLPDDITITPILVPAGSTGVPGVLPPAGTTSTIPSTSAARPAESGSKPVSKPKDVVHVINPRSGTTTTIAKHMSSASTAANSNPPKSISSVRPNNAVNVGRINPDLDVIVIAPAGRRPISGNPPPVQRVGGGERSGGPCVNVVQPEVRSEMADGVTGPKRKGVAECADGLERKRARESGASEPAVNGAEGLRMIQQQQRRKSASPTAARALPREQVFEMRNSTIVNEREAVAAASAVVVPSARSQFRLSPHKNGLKRGRAWNLGLKVPPPGHNSLNVKPVVTRSSTANAKIKTRSSVKDGPVYTSRVRLDGSERSRNRLLRRRVPRRDGRGNYGHQLTISTNGRVKSRSPYLASPSSASSSSSGGQVILRIPRVGTGSGSHHHHHHHSDEYNVSSSNNDHPRSLLVPATALRSGDHHHAPGDKRHFGQVDYVPGGPHLPPGRHFVVGEASGKYKAQVAGSMAFSALKKRAIVKPLSPNVMNGALHSMMMLAARRQPKWSNGWRFEGEPFEAKVYLTNDDQPVIRRCYPAMKHDGGDVIQARDCVLLKSGPRKTDLPFVAKVAALWENPVDGEMMFSLLWYYRPEHTEIGRTPEDMPDEIFASKHRDCNSVATIEDRCFVLTLNEYCRYKKRLKQLEEGITGNVPLVPLTNSSQANINSAADIALAVWYGIQGEQRRVPAPGKVSPDVVFFCRKVYDFRQKRMLKNPS